jgi:GAF domain-containing protein
VGALDEDDLTFVQRLADHAAIAIENARLHAETQQRLQEQVALRTAGEVISSALDLDIVLSRIAEQMARTVDATSAYICDYDLESGNSTVIAEYISAHAAPQERLSDLGSVYPEDEEGFISVLAREDYDISYIDDPGLSDQEQVHMEEYGAKTILYVPFRIRGQVIGFVELWESRRRRVFTPDEIALCQGIAHQAAFAIENARLYQESRRRAEDMALLYQVSLTISSHLALDQVLEAIYAQMQRVWDPPVFFIALYDAAEDALDFAIYVDRGERLASFRQRLVEKAGFSAWIVRNRQPLLIRDWQKESSTSPVKGIPIGDVTRSWLGVPLLAGDEVVGVMSVQDYAPGAFGQEHERFLSTIASEVVIAIENARLYQQSEAYAQELAVRAERLALVNRISTAVNSTLDLDEILETATRQMAQAFQVKQAGTVLLEGETGYGRLVAEYRERARPRGDDLRIPVRGNPSMERVILTRQPLVIADASTDPLAEGIRDVLQARGIHSMLIVPLVVQDKVIGTIGLDAIDGPRAFTPDEIDLAQTLANQVSLAVENVRLYQETQQRLREVTLLFDTSAAVSKTLDLDTVLQTTAEEIAAALDADGCTIAIWDQEENALVTQLDYSTDPGALAPEPPGARYSLEQHPTLSRVLDEQQTVVLQAGHLEADAPAAAWLDRRNAGSALWVPMVARDKAFGLLELLQAGQARKFTANEIRLCQTLANQAAAAIDNARLYEGVRLADQAKSEFIDFVAHELKQPMTAMQGYAKMLTLGIGGELNDTQTQFVDVITSNVDRMGKLVSDLLEISRLEAGRTTLKLEPVNLELVVQETIVNTRTEIEARKHTLEVETPEELPPVMGDRVRLVQILTNLVSNAYKYTPEGGLIRIAVDGQDQPEVPAGHLCISVSDTGIGMSPQELLSLEEKFFRADHDLVQQQPGTGLGVSITRNLVTLHGGEFFIESEPGKGSTFVFTLPVAGPEAGAPEPPAEL